MIIRTLIVFMIYLAALFVAGKSQNRVLSLICVSFALAALLLLLVGMAFTASAYFYTIYSVEPYHLTYKEVLSSTIQIFTFIGGTCTAAAGVYFTARELKKKYPEITKKY